VSLTSSDFGFISGLVRESSAIVLEPGKEYLVEARLAPVARLNGLAGVEDLVKRLQSGANPGLKSAVIDAMTTNETSWFRDRLPFTALTKSVLPDMLKLRASTRTLNVWSAACSAGQEPYSIAMLINEMSAMAGWRTKILATDLSDEMLAKARSGTYSQLEINRGLPAPLLVKNFRRVGGNWVVNPAISANIEFRSMNLARPWPTMPQMDIVYLRNVLIYFDLPTRRAIFEQLSKILRPDGYLFLGAAETTVNIHPAFERVTLDGATTYRLTRGE
jgi:chemotaxis protein methyltransferase CheR